MYERPKQCQNCYFFQRRWKKVPKRAYAPHTFDFPKNQLNSRRQVRWHEWHEYEKQDYGICRRYPPQLVTYTHNSTGSQLPTVDEDSFCGEWKEQTFDVFDTNA